MNQRFTPGGILDEFQASAWQSFFRSIGNSMNSGTLANNYLVAQLPAGSEGAFAYATDGRKIGEGAGAGTGVPVYYSNGQWRVFSTDAQVAS